jgi:hypothetical protein
MGAAIHGQGRKDQHRDRVGHVAPHAAGCLLVGDRTCGHGVIAADAAILIGDDKCAADAAELIARYAVFEPVIEAGFAALEQIELVLRSQRLWRAQLQVHAAFVSQGALTAIRRSSPGLAFTGASSRSVNALKRSLSSAKKT